MRSDPLHRLYSCVVTDFFFKQKAAYEMPKGLEFRRVLFRSVWLPGRYKLATPCRTSKGHAGRVNCFAARESSTAAIQSRPMAPAMAAAYESARSTVPALVRDRKSVV